VRLKGVLVGRRCTVGTRVGAFVPLQVFCCSASASASASTLSPQIHPRTRPNKTKKLWCHCTLFSPLPSGGRLHKYAVSRSERRLPVNLFNRSLWIWFSSFVRSFDSVKSRSHHHGWGKGSAGTMQQLTYDGVAEGDGVGGRE
jgi:hypothetical protein